MGRHVKPRGAEHREKLRVAAKAAGANPEVREKRRAAAKATWANPEVREKLRAALNRPEVREKLRAAAKATWANPEVREKLRATRQLNGNSLSPDEKRKIVDMRSAGARVADLADDWLVSVATIYNILKEASRAAAETAP